MRCLCGVGLQYCRDAARQLFQVLDGQRDLEVQAESANKLQQMYIDYKRSCSYSPTISSPSWSKGVTNLLWNLAISKFGLLAALQQFAGEKGGNVGC